MLPLRRCDFMGAKYPAKYPTTGNRENEAASRHLEQQRMILGWNSRLRRVIFALYSLYLRRVIFAVLPCRFRTVSRLPPLFPCFFTSFSRYFPVTFALFLRYFLGPFLFLGLPRQIRVIPMLSPLFFRAQLRVFLA